MAGQSRLYHNPQLTSDVKNWRWVGENVGYGPDALTVHVAFMNSPAHKANILDRDYTEVGIGAVVVERPGLGRRGVPPPDARHHQLADDAQPAYPHKLATAAPAPRSKRVQARLGVRQTGYYGTYTTARCVPLPEVPGLAGPRQRRPEDLVPAVLSRPARRADGTRAGAAHDRTASVAGGGARDRRRSTSGSSARPPGAAE